MPIEFYKCTTIIFSFMIYAYAVDYKKEKYSDAANYLGGIYILFFLYAISFGLYKIFF